MHVVDRVFKAQPNAAHVALAKFTIPLFREQVSPGSTFTLITQNVDELSRKALESVRSSLPAETIGDSLSDPEHPPLIEMHGSLFDLECTAYECKHRETNYNSPLCPALAGTELIYEVGSKEREPDIPKEELPRCSKCGSLQRPGMVWFGEVPYRVEEVMKLTEKADLILVVGTSSVVCTKLHSCLFELITDGYAGSPCCQTCRNSESGWREGSCVQHRS